MDSYRRERSFFVASLRFGLSCTEHRSDVPQMKFFQRNFTKYDIKVIKLTIMYNNSKKRLHCLRNGSKKQIIYLIFR